MAVTAEAQARPAFPGLLEEMTVEEIRAFQPEVVVLPLGSTEPHGPHLPLGTDTYQVTALSRLAVEAANRRGGRVLLYPTLPITNNANVRAFPFALRMGIRTLMSVIIDIVTQCREDGIRKVVIVNGHGGNPAAIDAALREIAAMDGMPFVCWTWGIAPDGFVDPIKHPSDHGGESETSRIMDVRPISCALISWPTIPLDAFESRRWPTPCSSAPGTCMSRPAPAARHEPPLPKKAAPCTRPTRRVWPPCCWSSPRLPTTSASRTSNCIPCRSDSGVRVDRTRRSG